MQNHIDAHLSGALQGHVPTEFLQAHAKSRCRVCGLCVAASRGVHPRCRRVEQRVRRVLRCITRVRADMCCCQTLSWCAARAVLRWRQAAGKTAGQAMPGSGLWLIVAGGLCFSIGVLFYVAKSKKYTHAIWHLFVIGGCSCHYFSIYYYVV